MTAFEEWVEIEGKIKAEKERILKENGLNWTKYRALKDEALKEMLEAGELIRNAGKNTAVIEKKLIHAIQEGKLIDVVHTLKLIGGG